MTAVGVGGRAERLLNVLGERDLDQMMVSDRSNIRWLSGFTGSAGVLIISARGHVLVTDGRYTEQARDQLDAAGATDVEVVSARTLSDQHSAIIAATGGTTIGAEASVVSHGTWSSFAAQIDLVGVDGVISDLRRSKDDAEVELIAQAADIASRALADVAPMIAVGVTEREVRDELEYRMRKLGADGPSYETIVASGPTNAALPHARPTTRRFVEGDTVVIDVGALVSGYHSDMTRTFVVGAPTIEQGRWYELVLESQMAGLEAVAAGVRVSDVDRACRSVFESAGLSDLFVHGTGHGVGLDIHEEPFLGASGQTELVAGDVVTVEPGLYRVGTGGIRIEDLVVVTSEGYRNLTTHPKDSPCLPSRRTT